MNRFARRSENGVDIAISRSSFGTKRLRKLSLYRLVSQMNAKCASMIMFALADGEQHIHACGGFARCAIRKRA